MTGYKTLARIIAKRIHPAIQTAVNRKSRRKTGGFTLMEVLVVLIIITILAGFVGINVLRKPGEARVAAAKIQVKTLQTAVKLYHAEQHVFPSQSQGLDALVAEPVTDPVPDNYPEDGYLDTLEVPLDPWGNEYIYLVPGRHGESFEIICYGADGEPGGEDEDADISSSSATL